MLIRKENILLNLFGGQPALRRKDSNSFMEILLLPCLSSLQWQFTQLGKADPLKMRILWYFCLVTVIFGKVFTWCGGTDILNLFDMLYCQILY